MNSVASLVDSIPESAVVWQGRVNHRYYAVVRVGKLLHLAVYYHGKRVAWLDNETPLDAMADAVACVVPQRRMTKGEANGK